MVTALTKHYIGECAGGTMPPWDPDWSAEYVSQLAFMAGREIGRKQKQGVEGNFEHARDFADYLGRRLDCLARSGSGDVFTRGGSLFYRSFIDGYFGREELYQPQEGEERLSLEEDVAYGISLLYLAVRDPMAYPDRKVLREFVWNLSNKVKERAEEDRGSFLTLCGGD